MIRTLPSLLLTGLLLTACGKPPAPPTPPAKTVQTTLSIEGMTCEGCVKGITRRLSALPGVVEVRIRLDSASGTVTHDPQATSAEGLIAAVNTGNWKASLASPTPATTPLPSESPTPEHP